MRERHPKTVFLQVKDPIQLLKHAPTPKFDEKGLIPAIVQDCDSREVLMLAYMNQFSLEKTLSTGYTHFWSRSRNCLWKKGGTSGHVQRVREVLVDCDRDTLLIRVEQTGPACHTGQKSCFSQMFDSRPNSSETKRGPRGKKPSS